MVRQLTHSLVCRSVFADFSPLIPRPTPWNQRSIRIAILLSVLVLLNLMDLRYTIFAHQVGMLGEMNPIAANFLNQGLEPSLISYKLLSIIVATVLFWRARTSAWVSGACWGLVLLYLGLNITWLCWAQVFDELKLTEMAMLVAH